MANPSANQQARLSAALGVDLDRGRGSGLHAVTQRLRAGFETAGDPGPDEIGESGRLLAELCDCRMLASCDCTSFDLFVPVAPGASAEHVTDGDADCET